MIRAKIGHLHLKVSELYTSIDFYSSVLGFVVTESISGSFAFLSGGPAHHELALQEVGAGSRKPDPHSVGLYHSAFEVSDETQLALVVDELERRSIPRTLVDHGISKALYFPDPDGNGVEVYIDTRDSDRNRWEGVTRRLSEASLRRTA
jgi:catechol 2,3-dioxygenase